MGQWYHRVRMTGQQHGARTATARLIGHPVARAVFSAALGTILVLAFPPYDLWPLAVLAPAGLALATRGQPWRRAGVYGLAMGLGFFVPLLHWTGLEVGPIPWLLLAVLQALFFVPLGIGVGVVQRLPGWPIWAAAVWVAVEALRGRVPYGGLTWGKLAFAQADGTFTGLAALGGSPVVSFGVALCGSLLAWLVVVPAMRLRLVAAGSALGVGAAGLIVPAPAPDGPSVTIAAIQGNAPTLGMDFNARARAVTENHRDVTMRLADDVEAGRAPRPDLVIWPENAPDRNPFRDGQTEQAINTAVDRIGVPILVSAILPTADEQNVENTSILWDPDTGPGDTYVKRHPMPFGEYIPFRSIAEQITDAVRRQPRDHVAGNEVGLFSTPAGELGVVICFEVGFDNIVRDTVTDGAQVLAVQTNNAHFRDSPMSSQHLAQSQLRAVEHGRSVIVAALTGISAIIGPDGEVRDRTEIFTQDVLIDEITLSDRTTVATMVGQWPEWALTAIGVVTAGLAIIGARRRARPAETTTDTVAERVPAGLS